MFNKVIGLGHVVRGLLLASSSTAALAQTSATIPLAASSPIASPASASDGADSQTASSSEPQVETGGLKDIVVTANKRREPLQKVPVAVTVVSAATASSIGVTDIASLQTMVPGLQFPKLFSGSSPALRGIGTNFGIGGVENVVPIYVDDVYIPSPSATTFSFNNIDQVEVLKGPQGTLFGRNALAGVINITTRAPSDTPTSDMSLGYANYNTISGAFYGSAPLSSNLRADLAIAGSDQMDGWGKNLFNGRDVFTDKELSIRSKWVYKPGDHTTLTAIFDFSYSRYDSGIGMRPVRGAVFPNPGGVPFAYPGYYNINENVNPYVSTKQAGVSLKFEQDLGFATLTDVIARRHSRAINNADEDQTPLPEQYLPIDDKLESLSEELRLTSKSDGRLHWLVGAFYFHDLSTLDLSITGTAVAPLSIFTNFKQKIDSYAGFGQATYDFPAGFHLTGGLRYTFDKIRENAVETLDPIVVIANRQSTSEHALTYKVNLAKDIARSISAYVGYSTAFHGGVYNSQNILSAAVKPEKLYALEAGVKSELFDHLLRLNAALYHYSYKNIQVTSLTRAATGQTSQALANAAEATNTGFEFDVQARPTRALTLFGGASIMHARFKSFPDATISIPQSGGGNVTISGSAKGLSLPHAPDFSGNIGGEYRIATGAGDVIPSLNYSYQSSFAWDADNRLKQKRYGLLNGSLRWTPSNGDWQLMLWGKNLTNVKYSVYTTANVVGDEESPGAPLTFGITVSRHF
jgi:iron complex outermembrane receptor protein